MTDAERRDEAKDRNAGAPSAGGAPTPSSLRQGSVVNERYRIVDSLGKGGMGQVFLAEDLWSSKLPVALKKLRNDRLDRNQVASLRAEFLTVAHLAHPNLVQPYDFGRDWEDGDFFFTSEFVDGEHIDAGLGAYDTKNLCEALAQACRALDFLHNHGLVHGDIKPENMLIQAESTGGAARSSIANGPFRIRLIDFGLTVRERGFIGKKILGTAYYIAPEAILGSMLDRRTDLYSLGVVFYRLATGHLPFKGTTNLEILKGHLERQPPLPHERNPQVPPPFSNLIMRLMSKKPSHRPASGAEVLAALAEIAGTQFPIETPASAQAYLRSNPLVGRGREVHALETLAERGLGLARAPEEAASAVAAVDNALVPAGKFSIIALEGAQGFGKERLLRELTLFAQTRGALVCSIGPERAAEELATRMGIAPNPATVLERLGELSRKQPLLLLCRDFEGAREDAAAFVRALSQKVKAAPRKYRVLTCLSVSTDRRSPALSQLLLLEDIKQQLASVRLEPFSHVELRELVETAFGEHRFAPTFVEQVAFESEGSPGAAMAIIAALMADGKLVRTPEGWTATFASLADVVLPSTGRRHLEDKIRELDPLARRMGEELSVLGIAFPIDLVRTLTSVPPTKILGALAELRSRGLLVAVQERLQFASRSIRDILYHALPETARAQLHAKAAAFLAAAKAPPTELFQHFLVAGDHAQALRCGLEGAAMLRRSLDLEQALDIFTRLKKLPEWAAQSPEAELCLADTLASLGRNREAHEALNAITARTGIEDRMRCDTLALLAGVTLKLGRPGDAGRMVDQALRIAKDTGYAAVVPQLLYGAAALFFARGDYRQSAATATRALKTAQDPQARQLAWRIMLLRAESLARLGSTQEALAGISQAMESLDNRRSPDQMTASLRCLAAFWRYREHAAKSITQLQICRSACQRLQLKDDEIECVLELAAMHLSRGEAPNARHYALQALKDLEVTANRVLLLRARLLLAESAWYLGYYEESKTQCSSALQLAKEFDNSVAHLHARTILARVVSDQGNIPAAEQLLGEAASQCHYEESVRALHLAQSHVACLSGKWDKVWGLLEDCYAKGAAFHPEGTLLAALSAASLGKSDALDTLREGLGALSKREDLALIDAMHAFLDGLSAFIAQRDDHGFARFNDALRLSRSARSDRLITWACLFLGRALVRNRQHEQAYLTFEEGLFMAKRLNLVLLKGYFWYEMGLLELSVPAGDLHRAAEHLTAAETTARKHGLSEILALALAALGRTEARLGRFADAQERLAAGIRLISQTLENLKGVRIETTILARELKSAQDEAARIKVLIAHTQQAQAVQGFFGLLGRSAAIQEVFRTITAMTAQTRWVWVSGPKGSGKTGTARAIHQYLRLPDERLRFVECLDMDERKAAELLASLAGGKVDTLVLEEVSNLSGGVQEKLCRALAAAVPRVIATTAYAIHELFETEVLRRPCFPEATAAVALPPLSARGEDIEILAAHFLSTRKPEGFLGTIRLSADALALLRGYQWPRNVEELREFCGAAYTYLSSGKEISAPLARAMLAPTKSVPAT